MPIDNFLLELLTLSINNLRLTSILIKKDWDKLTVRSFHVDTGVESWACESSGRQGRGRDAVML